MKKVALTKLSKVTGGSFLLAVFDENDNIVRKPNGEVEIKETSSLLDVIKYFILRGIPRDKYTKNDAIHAASVYRSIQASDCKVLELDEDDHDWLKTKINDDSCGVRMFTIDQTIIAEALDNFEKLHQPGGKE